MIILLILILSVYVAMIGELIYGFDKIKMPAALPTMPKTFFSIVVPFRNESKNLPLLLDSIKKLQYPVDLFEIILVDDFSDDDSVRQVYQWRMANGGFQTTLLENIRRSQSPKKDAISRAMPIVKNQWVITTDADCVVPEQWLLALDQYIQQHDVAMVVGSVTCASENSFLHHFQQLDLTSLQGTTIGSFGLGLGFLCNGANFCYTKSFFNALNGFDGNNQLASGDDVFLLQKAMRQHPEKVRYLKSKANIVVTKPLESWRSLFFQRVRWASKTGSYDSVFGKDLAVIVLLGNLGVLLGLGLAVAKTVSWWVFALLFGVKFIFDFILLYKSNRFLSDRRMRFLFGSSILYPFFCVGVALYSFFGGFEWKDRAFQK